MTTLILSERISVESSQMGQAALRSGWGTTRVGWTGNDLIPDSLVFYGEPLFAAVVAEQMGHVLLEPRFDWLATLPRSVTKREIGYYLSLEALEEHVEFPSFVKPADLKSFPAAVYHSMVELRKAIPDEYAEGKTPEAGILVSGVVEWSREYRVFIRDTEMTVSAYKRDGVLDTSSTVEERYEVAKEVMDILHLAPDVAPAFVLDIGLHNKGGWAVVEANPCWGSGLYECDPDVALRVVQRACRPKKGLTEEDARWVFRREELE